MSGAAAIAGNAGHAFLASWYMYGDLALAGQAFDRVAAGGDRYPGSRRDWLSPSSANLFAECPAKYYLRKLHGGTGLDRVFPAASADTQLKQSKELGEKLAQARSACLWLASDPKLDGSDNLRTLGVELYMESVEPRQWRLFMDQLVYVKDMDALGVRDHKFTWRADARTYLRVAYGDQLGLYAAVWNQTVRLAGDTIGPGTAVPSWMGEMPLVRFLIPNVIVVSARGLHSVMPGEPIYFTEEREAMLIRRLHRVTNKVAAFTIMTKEQGWLHAQEHMQTQSCVGFSVCPYTPLCHEGEALDSDKFTPSTRLSLDTEEDGD